MDGARHGAGTPPLLADAGPVAAVLVRATGSVVPRGCGAVVVECKPGCGARDGWSRGTQPAALTDTAFIRGVLPSRYAVPGAWAAGGGRRRRPGGAGGAEGTPAAGPAADTTQPGRGGGGPPGGAVGRAST